MTWLFIAAAIFGGGLLIPMLLGLGDSDVGELDADLDVGGLDLDTDLDSADAGGTVDVAGSTGVLGAITSSLVSLRSAVFASAFFGGSGLLLTALDYEGLPLVLGATVVGLGAALANSTIYGLLKQSESTSHLSSRSLEGRPAHVVLPIEPGGRGRIRVDLSGQPHFVVAGLFEDDGDTRLDVGASVVVVEMQRQTALVAPLAGLDQGEEV